jgi:hypothetical protein
MDLYNYEAMQLAKKACWRRPKGSRTTNTSQNRSKNDSGLDYTDHAAPFGAKKRDPTEDFVIERKFPRKIYLRDPGELT